MKKIALTLLFLFLITPCMANIHINPSTVESVVKEFVPADKMVSVISEYNNQIKQSNDTGISAQVLWDICAIAGWDIKKTDGKNQCKEFVYELVRKASIKFNPACAKENKGKTGYICVDDFFTNKFYGGTQVNLTPALTLAKEYIRIQHNDNSAQCKTTNPREIKVVMGATDYGVQCTSHNQNVYYELIFDDVKEHKDETIKDSIQNAICRMYDAKPTTAGCTGGGANVSGTAPVTCWSASCAADSSKCEKINQSMAKFGYIAEYKNGKCEINFDTVTKREDLKTAYGIDNFVFCHGIQVANTPNVETYLKQYVAERAGVSESSVKCDSGFNTYTGTGCTRNGITDFKDDIKTCHVGNNQIDFVFDDINEKKKKTVEGGVQAMSCIVTGGTYSGERCIGLGEQQCEVLRQSNLTECPECKAAKWDDETQSCILPSSKSAQNLQKGVNIGLIVGGAVVGVVLTVVTAGAAGAPVTAIVLTGIETVGAGIEITSQLKINGIADDFLVESNKCNSESCAKELVKKHLTELARIGRDLTDAEADATDKEMARLIGLIPANSDWWIESLKMDDGSSLLEKANDGGWTPAQVWRAIGIGMQFAGVASSITGWIIKKTGYLEKTLDRTSKILLNSAKTAEKNIVKVDKLDDVGKEWYKLWQEYAPKNQTLEQFKAMTNGNLDEMKQMAKNWTPRSKRVIINAQIDKQLDDITAEVQRRSTTFENLMDKYNIDALPADPDELAQLYKQHPDLEQATKTLDYARAQELKLQDAKINHSGTAYSTFDPEFSKTFAAQRKIDKLDEQKAAIMVQYDEHAKKGAELYKEAEKYDWSDPRKLELHTQASKEYNKSSELFNEWEQLGKEQDVLREQLPTQWDIAEKYQLQNLGNVTSERAKQFEEIIKNNPEIESKLNDFSWSLLSDQERADVAQKILDEYAVKTGTPRATVGLDVGDYGGYHTTGTNNVVFNPNAQIQSSEGMVETMTHEHGHMIDDLAPNEGALGEQYSYYANKIYNNTKDAGYRVALTEQSSYKIGPNVSHEATGTTHYSYGNEYDLEAAKRSISYANENLDRQVGYGAATAAEAGIVVGTANQVIDDIQNKKDKK